MKMRRTLAYVIRSARVFRLVIKMIGTKPVHPAEILLEEFLRPMGVSQYRLAKDISVPPRRINEIVQGKRALTADTALRLAKFFGTSDIFWLNLQARYDLDVQKQRLGKRLREIRPYKVPGRRATAAAYERKAK